MPTSRLYIHDNRSEPIDLKRNRNKIYAMAKFYCHTKTELLFIQGLAISDNYKTNFIRKTCQSDKPFEILILMRRLKLDTCVLP